MEQIRDSRVAIVLFEDFLAQAELRPYEQGKKLVFLLEYLLAMGCRVDFYDVEHDRMQSGVFLRSVGNHFQLERSNYPDVFAL